MHVSSTLIYTLEGRLLMRYDSIAGSNTPSWSSVRHTSFPCPLLTR